MKFKTIYILLFVILPLIGFSQEGNIYLHNYNSKLESHHTLSIYQGHNGLMYFINHKGIVSYDGVHWKNLKVHNTPESESVAPGRKGKVYVGCHQNFGYINTDNLGNEKYVSLNGKTKVEGDISKIEFTNHHVYFFSSRALYRVNLETNKFDKFWLSAPQNPFEGITMLNNKVYIQIKSKGLFSIDKNEKLIYVSGLKQIGNNKILSSFPYNTRENLIATDSNKLFLFDGYVLKPFKIECQKYIETNILSCGADLSATEFVLGTLSGGCIIIDKSTGNTKYTINYQTGLPDDEITSLGKDAQGGLWIAHPSGVTRADNNLPVKKFSVYPGLEGHIISTIKLNDTLYVATSEGLYYLSKVESIEDIQEFIRDTLYTYRPEVVVEDEPKVFKKEAQIQRITKTVTIVQEKAETKFDKVLSLFTGKRNKKGTTIQEKIDTVKIAKTHTPIAKKPVIVSLKKKTVSKIKVRVKSLTRKNKEIYAIQSIPYVYKKVQGINGKCRQLISYKNGLLVASNLGLFYVKNLKSKQLLNGHYVNYIHQSISNPSRIFVGSSHGFYQAIEKDGIWNSNRLFDKITPNINSIAEENGYLWLGAFNQIIKIPYKNDVLKEAVTLSFHNGFSENIQVQDIEGKIAFFFASGIMKYDYKKGQFIKEPKLEKFYTHSAKYLLNQPSVTWTNSNSKWKNIFIKNKELSNVSYLDLFDKIQDIYTDPQKNLWVVHDNTLHLIKNTNKKLNHNNDFFIDIRSVKGKDDVHLDLDSITLDYNNSYVAIEVSAPFYLSENSIEYQYKLEGLHHEEWSKLTRDPFFEFTYLPAGSYVLHMRAKNVFDSYSPEKLFYITIQPPFWKTTWFILVTVFFIAFLIYIIIFYRLKSLEKANKILEEKVRIRTQQVNEQKEELIKQKSMIENLYDEVTDSIEYAQKIQLAILPSEIQINTALNNSFVYFKPKNIVSGDFYWFTERPDRYIIAAVDCTGHGVPGAFMSMIGNTLLNQIINERNIVEPAEALNSLHKGIRRLLKQDQADNLQKDGMDIVLISVHKFRNEIQYAGANNSLFYIEEGEVKELKADKYSIGGLQKEQERKFTNHTLQLSSKTTFFLTSDGYQDQFDKNYEKKFTSKRMKQLFLDIYTKSGVDQKEILDSTLNEWRGEEEQMDDLMIIGFTINPE